jgi:transmembrane sensor
MTRKENMYRVEREAAERSAAEHLSLAFSGQATPRDLAAADAWRAEDPEHELAWVRLQAIWDASLSVADDPRIMAMRTQARAARPAMLRFNQWRNFEWQKVAVAASLTLAVGLSAYVASTSFNAQSPSAQIAWSEAVSAARVESIALADGSSVTMNSGAVLRTSIQSDARRVDLRQGGAYFDVAHNKDARFTVSAGDVSVTALGTSFSVVRDENLVTVTLVEGSVRVNSAGSGAMPAGERLLRPGEQLTISAQGFQSSKVDAKKATQWARSMQEFHAVPLSQVVSVVNSASQRQIRIQGSSLAERRFSGLIPVSDADHLVALLTEEGMARIVSQDGNTVILTAP